MTIAWATGAHESGLDHGVLYTKSGIAVPWNGLVSVEEGPAEATATDLYFDGIRYNLYSNGDDFSASVEAITYPDEFEICLHDARETFGLSYRVTTETASKIHLVYNATAKTSSRTFKTRSQSMETSNFMFDILTKPREIDQLAPASHLIVDTSVTHGPAMAELEEALYGTATSDPYLPTPEAIVDLFDPYAVLVITDNGDGTWTASGPDSMVYWLDDTTFVIDTDGLEYNDADTYTVRSW